MRNIEYCTPMLCVGVVDFSEDAEYSLFSENLTGYYIVVAFPAGILTDKTVFKAKAGSLMTVHGRFRLPRVFQPSCGTWFSVAAVL